MSRRSCEAIPTAIALVDPVARVQRAGAQQQRGGHEARAPPATARDMPASVAPDPGIRDDAGQRMATGPINTGGARRLEREDVARQRAGDLECPWPCAPVVAPGAALHLQRAGERRGPVGLRRRGDERRPAQRAALGEGRVGRREVRRRRAWSGRRPHLDRAGVPGERAGDRVAVTGRVDDRGLHGDVDLVLLLGARSGRPGEAGDKEGDQRYGDPDVEPVSPCVTISPSLLVVRRPTLTRPDTIAADVQQGPGRQPRRDRRPRDPRAATSSASPPSPSTRRPTATRCTSSAPTRPTCSGPARRPRATSTSTRSSRSIERVRRRGRPSRLRLPGRERRLRRRAARRRASRSSARPRARSRRWAPRPARAS